MKSKARFLLFYLFHFFVFSGHKKLTKKEKKRKREKGKNVTTTTTVLPATSCAIAFTATAPAATAATPTTTAGIRAAHPRKEHADIHVQEVRRPRAGGGKHAGILRARREHSLPCHREERGHRPGGNERGIDSDTRRCRVFAEPGGKRQHRQRAHFRVRGRAVPKDRAALLHAPHDVHQRLEQFRIHSARKDHGRGVLQGRARIAGKAHDHRDGDGEVRPAVRRGGLHPPHALRPRREAVRELRHGELGAQRAEHEQKMAPRAPEHRRRLFLHVPAPHPRAQQARIQANLRQGNRVLPVSMERKGRIFLFLFYFILFLYFIIYLLFIIYYLFPFFSLHSA